MLPRRASIILGNRDTAFTLWRTILLEGKIYLPRNEYTLIKYNILRLLVGNAISIWHSVPGPGAIQVRFNSYNKRLYLTMHKAEKRLNKS